MAQQSPRYCLYRDFVDAYMKCHYEMTRCVSFKKKRRLHSFYFLIPIFFKASSSLCASRMESSKSKGKFS
jgi:hypothetical protein